MKSEQAMQILPQVLAQDPRAAALARCAAVMMQRLFEQADLARVFPRVDQLPESLLDILAWDFKVDWWDYGLSIEQKRATLRDNWYVHRHLGTPASVKTALGAIFQDVRIEEWYDYGGKPYHFRLHIAADEAVLDGAVYARVMALVEYYKNLRSVLDSVTYHGGSGSTTVYAAAAGAGSATVVTPPEAASQED